MGRKIPMRGLKMGLTAREILDKLTADEFDMVEHLLDWVYPYTIDEKTINWFFEKQLPTVVDHLGLTVGELMKRGRIV